MFTHEQNLVTELLSLAPEFPHAKHLMEAMRTQDHLLANYQHKLDAQKSYDFGDTEVNELSSKLANGDFTNTKTRAKKNLLFKINLAKIEGSLATKLEAELPEAAKQYLQSLVAGRQERYDALKGKQEGKRANEREDKAAERAKSKSALKDLEYKHLEAARARNANEPGAEEEYRKVDEKLKKVTRSAGTAWLDGYSLSYWTERQKTRGFTPTDITKCSFASLLTRPKK